jgi:hypothetical protein
MALSAYQSHLWLDDKAPKGELDYQWMMRALEAIKRK